MRILAVNWQDLSNPHAGGAEIHLEEILKRVVQWGNEVTLACSNYPGGKDHETRDGLEIRRRGSRNTFNFVAPLLVRNILAERDYDLIVEDVNKIPFYLPIFFNLPHLIIIPHLFGKSIYQEANPLVASYVYFAEVPIPSVYSRSNFLVISESTKEDLIRRGITAEKIDVAECGVDHEVYTPDPRAERFAEPTIVYLGRLKRYKSVQHLIEAMPLVRERIPNAKALIVGDGDYAVHLRKRAEQLKLNDAVRFTGFVTLPDKLMYLRRSHVSIYPSPKEGWGITNIEANACGTPVLAADSPGLRDSVNPDRSGLLYEYGNIAQLAERAVEMLSNRPLYDSLCHGALEWAAKFTWDDCARRSFTTFERTLAEARRRA